MNTEQAMIFILNRLPCPVRAIDLPANVKGRALRTMREREQVLKCYDEYGGEYFYAINPHYRDLSVKSRVLHVVSNGTIRISVLKDKAECSKSAAYEAVKILIAENKVRIVEKNRGRFLVAI